MALGYRIVPHIIRSKCRTCPHSFAPNDMFLGICAYCWQDRSEKLRKALNTNDFSSNGVQRCYECHQPLGGVGYLHWVVDAKSFALYCIPCSDKKWANDGQYRGTKFAYAQKIQ